MTAKTCSICSGALELRYRGSAAGPTPDSFVPTNHGLGQHGDLFRCVDCGTVHQPALPAGQDLTDIYRDMADTDYLAEEDGRRATARRVLDDVREHVRSGRLLDVGCGHGLLLDEARKAGFDTVGLELSASAAAHARDGLELDVREQTLAELEADPAAGTFEVVVMADVLEHLDDPVAALDTCQRLLAPGGVLCVITPDPSSLTARAAGARWWGYVPAHTYLVPHTTLLELISARGLIVSSDKPLVRSFELRYWLQGLAERGGPLGSVTQAISRLPGSRKRFSMSLGDERVVIAHKVTVRQPEEQLMGERDGSFKVHVVLPAYKAAATIPEVAESMPVGSADRALLVDDASPDDTAEVALTAGLEVLRHPANRGYGANQKTCYVRAILDGADAVVMVHADNQYDPALVADMVKPIEAGIADVVIGSRLLEDEAVAGGMPRWKWVGNRFLTAMENAAFRRGYSEYHTGYRAFSTELLRSVAFLRNADEFVFDQQIFAQIVARRARVVELPIPTRYFLEASSVSFGASVKYGLNTLGVLARYRLSERDRPWALLRPPAARLEAEAPAESQDLASPR